MCRRKDLVGTLLPPGPGPGAEATIPGLVSLERKDADSRTSR